MSNPRHSAEGYRAICILLVIVIAALIWGWHNSEQNRLKLLDELQSREAEYEEKIYELKNEIESWKEEAGL